MSNAARRHYTAREGAAPTLADARREAVTQPTTPAPAGAVHAADFRPRVTGATLEPYDPETMAFGRRTRGPFARLED